jgi:hypothetical protein
MKYLRKKNQLSDRAVAILFDCSKFFHLSVTYASLNVLANIFE